jgi:hypothetical protein
VIQKRRAQPVLPYLLSGTFARYRVRVTYYWITTLVLSALNGARMRGRSERRGSRLKK